MKKATRILALLLALLMMLSLAACGGEETPTEPSKENAPTTEATQPTSEATEPATNLTVHENTFFTVGYNEEDGWSLAEDDIYTYDGGGNAYLRILDEDGNTDILVVIRAEEADPASFRENLYRNGFDQKAYVNGELETTLIGGQAMLYVDQSNGDRFFFGRNEAAGVTCTIDASNWEDPRVPALIENITFTATGTDNDEAPWPWEGEPISGGTLSQMVGTYTVTAEFLPMSESLVTYETFQHSVEVIGDKVYLLSDYALYEYTLEGSALTFVREIPLDAEYEVLESSNGVLVLSKLTENTIGHDGEKVVYSYDGPDKFSVAPDGTWGISWFYSAETTEKYTFQDGALVGEAMPFAEVKSISELYVDDTYIYISGSPAEGSGHSFFVYDHSGVLQMELKGDPNSSIGLGSITYMAKTPNGFLALDGNMRDVVLWTADGTWLGAVEAEDLFGTYYPWMATADVMPDGSILVVMTEERPDGSADEVIAFKVTVS